MVMVDGRNLTAQELYFYNQDAKGREIAIQHYNQRVYGSQTAPQEQQQQQVAQPPQRTITIAPRVAEHLRETSVGRKALASPYVTVAQPRTPTPTTQPVDLKSLVGAPKPEPGTYQAKPGGDLLVSTSEQNARLLAEKQIKMSPYKQLGYTPPDTGYNAEIQSIISSLKGQQAYLQQIKSSPEGTTFTIDNKRYSRQDAINYFSKSIDELTQSKAYLERYKESGYLLEKTDGEYSFSLPKASEVYTSIHGKELSGVALTSASFIKSPLAIGTFASGLQYAITGDEKVRQAEFEKLSEYALGLDESIMKGEYIQKVATSPAVFEGIVTPGLFLISGGVLSAGASRLAPALSGIVEKVGGTGAKIISGAKAIGTELSPYVGRVTGSPIGKGLMKYGMYGAFEGQAIAETAVTRPEELGSVLGESLFGWEVSWSAMGSGLKDSKYLKDKWVEKDIQKTRGFPELKQAKDAEGYGITQIQPMKQGETYFKSDVLITQKGAPDITAQAYGVGTSDIPGVTVTKGKAIYKWEQRQGLTKIEKIRIREIPGETVEVAKYGDVTITSEVGQVTRPEVDTRIASLIKRGDLLTPTQLYKEGVKSGSIYKLSKKSLEPGDRLYGAWFPHSGGGMYLKSLQPRTPLGSQLRSIITARGDPEIIKGLSPRGWLDSTFIVPERGEVIRHELIHGYQFDIAGLERQPIQKIGETTKAFEERYAKYEVQMEARTRNLASETMYFTKSGEPITYAEFQRGLPPIDEPTIVEGITKTQKILETKEGRIDLSQSVSEYKNVLADISGKQKTTSLVYTSKTEPQLTLSIRKPEAVPYPSPEEENLLLFVGKEGKIEVGAKYSGYMSKTEEESLLVTYGEKTGTRTKPLIEKPVKASGYTTKAEEDSFLVSYGEKTGTRTKPPATKRTTYLDLNEPMAKRTEEIVLQTKPKGIPTGGLVNTSGVESRITGGGLALFEGGRATEKAVLGETVSIFETGLLAGGTRQLLSPTTKSDKDKNSIGALVIKTETGLEEEGDKRVGVTLITPITDIGFDFDRDFKTGLVYDQGTITVQETKQDVIPIQETINEINPITETPIMPISIDFTIPKIWFPPPPRKKDEPPQNYFTKSIVDEDKGYDVYVKERSMYKGEIRKPTKFTKMNRSPLSHKDALSLGGDITDNTSAVSFRLKKVKEKPSKPDRPIQDFGIRSHKFYKKGETYIEKPDYRMDTPGELRGISSLGQEARREQGKQLNIYTHRKRNNSDLLPVKTPRNRSTGLLSRTTKIRETGLFKKKKRGKKNAYY